jgi:hypothetical protein
MAIGWMMLHNESVAYDLKHERNLIYREKRINAGQLISWQTALPASEESVG